MNVSLIFCSVTFCNNIEQLHAAIFLATASYFQVQYSAVAVFVAVECRYSCTLMAK